MSVSQRIAVTVAAAVFGVILLAAVMPELLWRVSPLATDSTAALLPPSPDHPFGTDQSGRDVLARVIAGARTSLLVGFGATAAALLVGAGIGVLAGIAGHRVDGTVSRGVEVLQALPELLLALVVVAIIGPGPWGAALAVGIAAVPAYLRVARAAAQQARGSEVVLAARVLGVHPVRIATRHVVPEVITPLATMATLGVGTAIVTAAGLGFLGLGPQPPTPEWGLMVAEGRNHLARAWWVAVYPGLAIMVAVLSTAVIGRVLRHRSGVSR